MRIKSEIEFMLKETVEFFLFVFNTRVNLFYIINELKPTLNQFLHWILRINKNVEAPKVMSAFFKFTFVPSEKKA